jgi:N-acetylneuraminic acid mutarotase
VQQAGAVVEPCAPPAPRINFSLVAHGSENKLEMVLFGGERNDGKQVLFYRELYRYSMWNNKWSHVSPGGGLQPGPRSGHAACMWKSQMFVFGGEFSTPKATQFHHYLDLWYLNLEDNSWEKVNARGRGPTVSPNGQLLSRRGRSLPADASDFDTHRDSISSRFDCRRARATACSRTAA